MRAVVTTALVLALAGFSCTRTPVRVPSRMPEAITITAPDNVRIAADWYSVAQPKGWALLLHMMPATKNSYRELAIALQEQGVASLAIDFRGHGASAGGPDGYTRFSDAQHQASAQDIAAAYLWLGDHVGSAGNPYDVLNPRLIVVGASIGANLALQFLRDQPTIAGAVLLSPGLDYRGVRTEPIARAIVEQGTANTSLPRIPILLVAGGTDDEYSAQTIRTLAQILGDRATTRTVDGFGHGTAILNDATFRDEIIQWITTHVQ